MRVGLLECDHVDDRYRAIGGDYREYFERLLGLELVPYDVVGGVLPSSPADCDGWLCTGSRRSVYDELPWIDEAAAFVRAVRDADIPYVGICFGHQLLASALGGTVERAPHGWGVGVHRVELQRTEPWMDPPRDVVHLQFMHQDQVTALPPGAVPLAVTDHCEVAAFRVGRLLGVQPHPEFTAAYAQALLGDRAERVGRERTEAAMATMTAPTDEAVVARWIVRFLEAS